MDDTLPDPVWRAALAALGAVLLLIGTVLIVILSGATDPKPLGALTIEESSVTGHGWEVVPPVAGTLAENTARLAGGPARLLIRAPYTVTTPGTVEISLSLREAAPRTDAGCGLWWGSAEDYTAVRFNGNGYLAVLSQVGGQVEYHREWMPYPHVRGGSTDNTIRVNLMPGRAEVWLNHEFVLMVERGYPTLLETGFFIETFDAAPAQAMIHRLSIWQD